MKTLLAVEIQAVKAERRFSETRLKASEPTTFLSIVTTKPSGPSVPLHFLPPPSPPYLLSTQSSFSEKIKYTKMNCNLIPGL